MPAGIPVATVAINGGKNAGLLALQILSLLDETIKEKHRNFRNKISESVKNKNRNLNKFGVNKYLQNY